MAETVLITGAAGFVGAHIVEHLLAETNWNIIALDRLNYAGTLERLAPLKSERVRFVYHDFRAAFPPPMVTWLRDVTYIIHNGAETHVDRSLVDPLPFVESNVLGTMNVLELARKLRPRLKHVILTSTDEVHGPAPDGVYFKEDAPIRPSNPYAATKAGAEALAFAWCRSYQLPVTTTRCMNMFGERQHPEKFVPLVIRNILADRVGTYHGGSQLPSRKWLHARNEADAILFLLRCGWNAISPLGECETYHIAGEEHTNIEIVELISKVLGKEPRYVLQDVHSARPGHDLRYSMDDSKIRSMGWTPPLGFDESLRRTVEWFASNPAWLET